MENKIIGNKITEARKKINISQAQLGERLFISPQAVGKWERGESFPDIITFNRLAKILGVDLNYFSEDFASITIVSEIKVEELASENQTPNKTKKKLLWDMSRGNWVDADFSGLKNLQEKFSSSNMKNCKFVASDLSGILLKSNNVDSCDFSSSDISKSQIQNSNFVNNVFKDCSLNETEFSGSHVYGCDFTASNFTGVVIKSGGFEKNIIANAVWKSTSFNAMYLADIVFEGGIEDCYFENCAFKRVTFQNAVLTNTFFKCRSLKGLKFIDCQVDRLTYEFLKNGKADLSGINLLND
ncbi:MAG: pentapeptide repeat-containing protein [Bacteroidota bacterium]